MRVRSRLLRASTIGLLLLTAGCGGNRLHVWYGKADAAASGSTMCEPMQSFFQANTYNAFSARAGVVAIGGADASYIKSVAYPRLVEDASRQSMAVAASACEAFEKGLIGEDRYAEILDSTLTVGFAQPQAALLDETQLQSMMTQLREALRREADLAAESQTAAVRSVSSQISQIADRLPVGGAGFQALVKQGASDRRDLEGLLRRMSANLSESQSALFGAMHASERREFAILKELTELRLSTVRLEASLARIPPAGREHQAEIDQIDVFFQTNSSTVEAIFVRALQARVSSLSARYPGATLLARVEGFADSRGAPGHNLALSRARADAVMRVLQGMNVPVTAEALGEVEVFGDSLDSNRVTRVTFTAQRPRADP